MGSMYNIDMRGGGSKIRSLKQTFVEIFRRYREVAYIKLKRKDQISALLPGLGRGLLKTIHLLECHVLKCLIHKMIFFN